MGGLEHDEHLARPIQREHRLRADVQPLDVRLKLIHGQAAERLDAGETFAFSLEAREVRFADPHVRMARDAGVRLKGRLMVESVIGEEDGGVGTLAAVLRGYVADGPDGPRLMKFERDGSGLISGLVQAEGLIDIPESAGDVHAGDPLAFIPFGEFGL